MSTVAEIKSAAAQLSPDERWELYNWLADSDDVQQRVEELRREIALGIEQADRGDLAPLDTERTIEEVRRRLRNEAA